ncbi:MAG: UDP-N-acetylmuramoyl-tripeptide--D-alanyl-D-alanine ligase [Actinomycetota bacterium]
MIELSVEEMARATGGDTEAGLSDLATFASVSTDSRTVKPGDLFVALRGEHYDGHDFLTSVVDKGAMGIVAARDATNPFLKRIPKQFMHITLIRVDDTLKAYQEIARIAARKLSAKVVAVTGSTGKTTTKDMIASILRGLGKTTASAENFNNEVGLPATILTADEDTEFMVLEMGMRGPGQIAELARIAKPHVGVITNIGLTHLELLGSEENIAMAKTELAAGVRPAGTIVVNAGDAWVDKVAGASVAKVITFGAGKGADVRAEDIVLDERVRASFTVIAKIEGVGYEFPVRLAVPGRHNVENALAAAAACLALGAPEQVIVEGLANARISLNRMSFIDCDSGILIINDTYNASPASVKAALETLAAAAGTRKIAVLGDMLELGDASKEAHLETGRRAAAAADIMFAVGELAQTIAEGAREAGMPADAVICFGDTDEAAARLRDEMKKGDVVLVKASRALRFERIVECIK